jgi:hypothetical protein
MYVQMLLTLSIKCLVCVHVLFMLLLPPKVILSLEDEHIPNLACKLCYQFIAFSPKYVQINFMSYTLRALIYYL